MLDKQKAKLASLEMEVNCLRGQGREHCEVIRELQEEIHLIKKELPLSLCKISNKQVISAG